ncbi:N-acetylmuramoyl-L-alanine amidase [Xanthobacter autotrophicus DSM 597]|uniref:N-acetylmuramoyl-L-alanine amidase n=1 Tax=Xanthobacter wiegelii TaxID=3119913 RepID=UPI0037263195
MAFTIDQRHRLIENGRLVTRIMSPAQNTGGAFARQPSILIMHFTYGASAKSSAEWFRDGPKKVSAHVVVDRDGTVIQCVDFDTAANHAGKSSWGGLTSFNNKSFGIELANWGYLKRSGAGWSSYTGVPIPEPFIAPHKNGNPYLPTDAPIGWEPYPQAQIATAMGIARELVKTYRVDTILGHDDIARDRKWDPGPAFDMARFRNQLLGDRAVDGPNTLTVRSPSGLNLRNGPGVGSGVLELLADGTVVEPVERSGNWVMVNVLDEAGIAQKTGWVHGAFLV